MRVEESSISITFLTLRKVDEKKVRGRRKLTGNEEKEKKNEEMET